MGILEPVDGGLDRACRGSSPGDNNPMLSLARSCTHFKEIKRISNIFKHVVDVYRTV